MEHREPEVARLVAMISRHRKQLADLGQQIIDVRQRLERDEHKLTQLKSMTTHKKGQVVSDSTHILECDAAAKALGKCAKTKREGLVTDPACSEAGRTLKNCKSARRRRY